MAKYDVTDQATLDASPEIVYRAIVDERDGRSTWWRPYLSAQLREGDSYDRVGALVDNTVAVHGKWPIRFVTNKSHSDTMRSGVDNLNRFLTGAAQRSD